MISQTTTTPRNGHQQEYIARAAWKHGVMGAFNVLATVLAVRLILLVAVGGAIFLTYLALQQPDPFRLGALAIFAVLVVVPTTVLACIR